MTRTELQRLSRLRRREARVLLGAGLHAGAYYLLGYSVECAIKACIARATIRHEFPDLERVRASYSHDLTKLIGVAGLQNRLRADRSRNQTLDVNWAVVEDWSEQKRYEENLAPTLARDMYSACTSRKNGVLAWVRKHW